MGWIHPAIMAATICGGLYTLQLGYKRARSLYFGQRVSFDWKRHVHLGTVVLALWGIGPALGLFGAQVVWGGTFIAPVHAWTGIAMLPLILTSYITGHTLDKVRRRRKWLPMFHGINSLILVLLSLVQICTGWGLLTML